MERTWCTSINHPSSSWETWEVVSHIKGFESALTRLKLITICIVKLIQFRDNSALDPDSHKRPQRRKEIFVKNIERGVVHLKYFHCISCMQSFWLLPEIQNLVHKRFLPELETMSSSRLAFGHERRASCRRLACDESLWTHRRPKVCLMNGSCGCSAAH